MYFKIDTKEKFHVITFVDKIISATMAENIKWELEKYLRYDVKNVVLNLESVYEMEEVALTHFVELQNRFMNSDVSLVFCCLQPLVQDAVNQSEFAETLNTAPTESEAWDIVHMDEISRDLLSE